MLTYLYASLPLLTLIFLLLVLRWQGVYAGFISWTVCTITGLMAFGLNADVFWVSQVKGLLLSLFVLAVLIPALLLYNLVDQSGGIASIARALSWLIPDQAILALVVAWSFSGMLEGLAGFGVPIAIASPLLVAMGYSPIQAVAAVAIGHSWSITYGDLGIIIQTLSGITGLSINELATPASVMLGMAVFGCGTAAMIVLKIKRDWWKFLIIAVCVSVVQYLVAHSSFNPLTSLLSGLSGVFISAILTRKSIHPGVLNPPPGLKELQSAGISYGLLICLMVLLTTIKPVYETLRSVKWQADLPAAVTNLGFSVPAGKSVAFTFFLHPGFSILMVWIFCVAFFISRGILDKSTIFRGISTTMASAYPSAITILATIGLSSIMEHCGMTQLLARGGSELFQGFFPAISPLIGILGAIATGSNNNSNVLFAPLQKNAADLLGINPAVLISLQTTGGSLGSMLAPAKIIVGCATTGILGQEGAVLRKTLPWGILLGTLIGLLTLAWIHI